MTIPDNDHRMHPVDAYLNHLSLIGHSAKTIAAYRTALRRAAEEMPAGLLALQDEIEAWLATRRATSTRALYRTALRGFYAWAVKRNMITDNPAADLPPVKRRKGLPRPCTVEELRQILRQARQPVRLWAALAAYAGARCVEIARLDRASISEQVTYLHGKGDKERVIPTHPALWRIARDLPPGLVAGGRTPHRVSNAAAAELDRIGLPAVTLHRLRHLAGTMWHAAIKDIRVTRQLLGHADVSTTQVYTAVSDVAMRAAVLAFPDFTDEAATGGDLDQG